MKSMKNLKIRQVWISLAFICLATLVVSAGDTASSFNDWRTVGPSGGDVRSITIDPKNKDHLFITTLDGQVYASYNAGISWQLLVNLKRPQLILDNLIVDARDSNIIYTSGHRHKSPGGFFKTIDAGKTWKEAKELKNEAIHAMIQSSLDPNMILVGTVEGGWVSKDSGETWKKFSSATAPKKLNSLAVDPRDVNTIYAGTWWRAYKTTDGGNSWKLIKNGMIDDSDVFAVDIDPKNPDNLVVGACSGIYKSVNSGENWTKVNGIPSQSRRTRDILYNPGRPGTIYAGTTEGFWMSTNGGKNFRLTTSKDIEINSIAVHPDAPNRVFIGTNNYGVMVSNDGGNNFELQNGNFSSRFTYNIVPDIEIPNRLYSTTINTATGGGFIFTSDDAGANWKSSVAGINTDTTITYSIVQDRIDPNKIYLATNFGIFESINRGLSWKQLTVPKPVTTTVRRSRRSSRSQPVEPETKPVVDGIIAALEQKINTLTHTEDGKNGYLAGTNDGLYRSYDISKGWTKINLGEGINEQVSVIHVSPKMPQVIWVGTATSGVIMSNDIGATWTKVPVIPQGVPISSIASNPAAPENIFVGTSQTLYMSKDWGKTWIRRGGNLPLGNYASILINPEKPEQMYVASALEADGGIFFSEDAGWSWKRIDSDDMGLASHRVWSLVFNPNNPDELLAGTHSSGIYEILRTVQPIANDESKLKNEAAKAAITRSRVSSSN
ncbi:MAG: WD40/YVTN/BNR-like repeat-containing protein [Aridibacter sp.]